MLIVRSPVRISFAGGGTDLPNYFEKFGGAVVSTSINKYFYTIVQKRNDGRVQIISSDLRVMETWDDIASVRAKGSSLEIPLAVLSDIGFGASIDMFLASEIPPGTGLGSSASACVGVLKALTTYVQKPLSKQELAEQAFRIARQNLGKPVGKQDEYAAAFGGLNFIRFNPDGTTLVEPLILDPELVSELQSTLLLFFTGASHDSWTILHEQEKSINTTGPAIESLHEIRAFAEEVRTALLNGDLSEFGKLMDEGWQSKKRVSDKISSFAIDNLYRIAREHGSLGGKITGAGGGGFLLLFCPHAAQASVRKALSAAGAREMNFEFDFQGAHVIVNDPFIGSGESGEPRWTFTPVQSVDLGLSIL